MHLSGEQQIGAPRERVWEALNDPDVLRRSIPGCQSLERTEDGGLAAVVEVKIGPIGARFNGKVAIVDPDPPSGYTLTGQGSGGMAGNAKGSAKVQLSGSGQSTTLHYQVDAEVGGRLAQLGGAVVEATARQLAARFFQNFEQVVTGAASAPVAGPDASPTANAAPVHPSLLPWIGLLTLAILAGFLLGRSDMGSPWLVALVLLAIACTATGFVVGRGGRG